MVEGSLRTWNMCRSEGETSPGKGGKGLAVGQGNGGLVEVVDKVFILVENGVSGNATDKRLDGR